MLITPWPIPSDPLLHSPSATHPQQTPTLAQSNNTPSFLLKPGSWMLLVPQSTYGLLPQWSPEYCLEITDIAPSSCFLFPTSVVCQISLFFFWPLPLTLSRPPTSPSISQRWWKPPDKHSLTSHPTRKCHCAQIFHHKGYQAHCTCIHCACTGLLLGLLK